MIARLWRAARARPAWVGVVGAVLLLTGNAWYQALVTPPYRFIDEQAHTGYVVDVLHGRVPEIDSPIDAADGGPELRARLADEPPARRDVWVANNPPLAYVVAAPLAAATSALGIPGGPLIGLRLANVAAAAGAVVLTYVLARDLAAGDRTIGLVAAGVVAAMPHLGFVAALGLNEGISLLATTAVALALARLAGAAGAATKRGTAGGVRAVRVLGLCAAAAALCRPMAALFAAAAVALGLLVTWRRRQAPFVAATAWAVGPTLVLASGWYVRNVVLYGDATGSGTLFDKFDRSSDVSLVTSLGAWRSWLDAFRTITTRRLEYPTDEVPRQLQWFALVLAVAAIAVTVVLVARSAWRGRPGRAESSELPVTAWLVSGVLALVPLVLAAEHRAGGGALHARYLLPALPIVAAAVALGLVRAAARWSGAALVVLVAAVSWIQTRRMASWLVANPSAPAGTPLAEPVAGVVVRSVGLAAMVVGLAFVVGAIAVTPRRR